MYKIWKKLLYFVPWAIATNVFAAMLEQWFEYDMHFLAGAWTMMVWYEVNQTVNMEKEDG